MSKYMGESRSAGKRRATRYGRWYSCGPLECNGGRRTALLPDGVKACIKTPGIWDFPENGGPLITNPITLALSEVEKVGKSEFPSVFKHNSAPIGMRSPEETPEFYNWGADFNAGSSVFADRPYE
uniref:Putative RNA-binding protein n=1 Tax=Grapevine virus B TaxID=35289 RepID=A0A1C9HB01_9VIRU|nr:putative RNA-binding protein [Grapevine virus B]